ncbi:MAG: hypothetical protein L6R35_007481, partial [Caloplaca aegaea]
SDCLELAQRARASVGRLEDEPLSEQERIWKEIKSGHQHDMETSKSGVRGHEYYWGIWGVSGIEDVLECLNEPMLDANGGYVNEYFENAVQYFHNRRAEWEKKRQEREEREAERQAKQKSELQGGKQNEQPPFLKDVLHDGRTSQQPTAKQAAYKQDSRGGGSSMEVSGNA